MKPILFNTDMVQAIIEGRKTMTRRYKGLKEINADPSDWQFEWADFILDKPWRFTKISSVTDKTLKDQSFYQAAIKCPYGKAGDVLWVRETFTPSNATIGNKFFYKADDNGALDLTGSWKPSIFMPKEACRLFLKITSIRVETLHKITNEDALAEGIKKIHKGRNRQIRTARLVLELQRTSQRTTNDGRQTVHGICKPLE